MSELATTDARSIRLVRERDLPAAEQEIRGAPRVALDTEFHTEGRYTPNLFLVQVHVPDGHTWILDPLLPGLLEHLAPALREVPTWLVHGGSQDLRLMHRALGGLPAAVLDTQIAAGLTSDQFPAGYDALVQGVLGRKVDKGERLSDWSRRPLTDRQLLYAAIDVQILPDLWDGLAEAAEAMGRQRLVQAACDEALAQGPQERDPDEVYRHLARGSSPDPDAAAALHALVWWREEEARRSNRPPPFVVSDGILRHIARSRPHSRQGLMSIRRLSDKLVQRYGDAMLEALAAAEAERVPRVVHRATPEARRMAWLQVWAMATGAERRWAPRLVLPETLLETLVQLHPGQDDPVREALGPWRSDLVFDDLLPALRGDVLIGLTPDGVSVKRHDNSSRKNRSS